MIDKSRCHGAISDIAPYQSPFIPLLKKIERKKKPQVRMACKPFTLYEEALLSQNCDKETSKTGCFLL